MRNSPAVTNTMCEPVGGAADDPGACAAGAPNAKGFGARMLDASQGRVRNAAGTYVYPGAGEDPDVPAYRPVPAHSTQLSPLAVLSGWRPGVAGSGMLVGVTPTTLAPTKLRTSSARAAWQGNATT